MNADALPYTPLLERTGRYDELAKGLIWARRCCVLAVVTLGLVGTSASPLAAAVATQISNITGQPVEARSPLSLLPALSQAVAVPGADQPADIASAAQQMASFGFQVAGVSGAGGKVEAQKVAVSTVAPTGARPQLYIAGGENGFAAVSRDARSWTVVSTGFGGDILAMADGNGRTVAVGEGGRVGTSTDGMSWSGPAFPAAFAGQDVVGVAFGDGQFVAVTASGLAASSSDGLNWVAVGQGAQPKGDAARRIFIGDVFLTAGESPEGRGQIATSRDGKTVAEAVTVGPAAFNAIAVRL